MAITNHERVGTAMELLRQGLAPFVERELHSRVETGAVDMDVLRRFEIDKPYREWDAAALLRLMWETWNDVFRDTLGAAERSLVSELRGCATSGRTRSPSPATTPTAPSTRPSGC